MNEFTHEMFGTLRTTEIDGNPWFVLADVCAALELSNPSKAASSLDDDEKGLTTSYTLGGDQRVSIISESGLYSLVLRSRKPEAKKFKRWVTHDVLPSLRRDGRYDMGENDAPAWARDLMSSVNAIAPLARAHQEIQETSGGYSLAETARRMGIGHHRLCAVLREIGVTREPRNAPTAWAVAEGLVGSRQGVAVVPEDVYPRLQQSVTGYLARHHLPAN